MNGEIDKRDFDELASHYFKSIDLSGAKVVAYEDSKADMVPKYAFEGNATLESFKMPAGVKELGSNAFMLTKLKEIDLPETIEEFGRNTFNACFELKDVYMRHKEAPYWISWCVLLARAVSCIARCISIRAARRSMMLISIPRTGLNTLIMW